MSISEANMTEKEIEKIAKAYSKELSSTFYYTIFLIIIVISFNLYYTEQGFYKLVFNLPVVLICLFQFKKIKLLFFDNIQKDFEQKRKIIITLIVSKKNDGHQHFDGLNSSDNIEFEKNKYFRSLDVSNSFYHFISVGDEINFELSKHGKWLIAVHSKSKNINYNNYSHRKSQL